MQIKKLNEALTNICKVDVSSLSKNIFEELDTIDDEVEVIDDNGKKLDTKETEEVKLTEDLEIITPKDEKEAEKLSYRTSWAISHPKYHKAYSPYVVV